MPESFTTPYYNYESNVSNYSSLKDWGISLQYGAEFSRKSISPMPDDLATDNSEIEINTNLYLLALAKRIGNHILSIRYTPGYQKEFLFATGESIIINDTTTQSLEANYKYRELFGLGYSYSFNEQFSAGFTFRFFNQDFNREIVKPVFGDTLYLVRESLGEEVNYWKADIGVNYILNDNFLFRLSSVNLMNFGDEPDAEEFQGFEMKQDIAAIISASYQPDEYFNLHAIYETSSSFQLGMTGFANQFVYGLTAFHDKYQEPFIAGIIPALGYRTDLFEILLSGVKYFSERNSNASFSKFSEEGIHNIMNNRYSFDKVVLSLSVNISGTPERKVELIDVEIVKEIYPAFFDKYVDEPFAFGKVVNISNETVSVTPSVRIEGINEERIQSPPQLIPPGDTVTVPFYMIIPEKIIVEKTVLSYADFYVTASANEPDDQMQKASLINSMNSWDGNVANLRYFIFRDPEFSINFSKNILSDYKTLLDTLPGVLAPFNKAKLLFNNFVKNLVYTADPRATAEYVQFPKQTIELKGGDCDDLSVAYCSLLESVGVQTALVDYKTNGEVRHVNVLFNTNLSPQQAQLITNNDSKYFIRSDSNGKQEVWIPLETTSLTNFDEAWNTGVKKFNAEAIEELGISTGKVQIIDVY
ncbi:MAG: transglutaminase domain-containing protein [bacterium]|nr:transglutaminase domain-containing protein [bacterium]